MNRILGILAALLLLGGARDAQAVLRVSVHPDLAVDPAWVREAEGILRHRALEATTYLWQETDCGLLPALDRVKFRISYQQDPDGAIVPASYTFPDSTVRLIPEYASGVDQGLARHVLQDLLRLPEPPETILRRCTPWHRAQLPDVVEDFILSETIHELYHDWQNRTTRFPAVEVAKSLLLQAHGRIGGEWHDYLAARGVDMTSHDREIARAEAEATRVQLRFWTQRYGEEPKHPLARNILVLMRAALAHYESDARR